MTIPIARMESVVSRAKKAKKDGESIMNVSSGSHTITHNRVS